MKPVLFVLLAALTLASAEDSSSITKAPASTTTADNPYATYPTVAKTASINGFADKIYDDLPECAKPCMFQNTGVTPCPYWDTGCLCVMPQFGGLIGSCIAENCKGSNVVSATSLATSICSSAGVWEPYWMIPASISSSLSVAAADTAVAETSSDPEPTSESSSTALEDVSSTSSTSIPENTSETSDEANSETASTENQSTSLAAEASTSSITDDKSSITEAPSTTSTDNPYATYPTVAKTASINGFADKIYDDLPECAKPCMFQNTGVTPCPYWDTGCLCVMPQFGGLIGSCIAENCKGSNVVSATSLATSICSSAGVWEPYWMIPASISSSLSVAAADTAVAETSSDPEPTSESSSTALEDVSSTSSTSIPENTSETSDEANSETASTENQNDKSSITEAPSTTSTDNPYATYPTVAKTASINGFADKIYDDLPECAKPCMFQNTGVTPCPYWDTGCLCVMPQFGGLIGSCIAENCKGSNVVSATSLATSICSSAGVWEPYWMIPASISSSLSVAAADTAVAETSSDPEPTTNEETSDQSESSTTIVDPTSSSIEDANSNITEAPSATSTDNPYATYPTVEKTASINGFADKIYDDLPECAKPCMFQNTGVTPCPYWDTGCLCVMPQFGGLIGSCIAENCKGSNVVSATSLATSICSSAGVWEPYWMIPASISSSLSVAAADTAVAETSSDPEPTSEASSTTSEDISSSEAIVTSTADPEPTSSLSGSSSVEENSSDDVTSFITSSSVESS
ncbi:uncharacterized protein RJT21DRAFT_71870, partial [Scheffersomyces amazonensis]|uniref:uncharacterized protein n=1 Tax=Scheffersomyces amazonensis TaxID=1078765 RepID=UPI00315DBC68